MRNILVLILIIFVIVYLNKENFVNIDDIESYFINLGKTKERKDKVNKAMKELNLKINRLPAFNGRFMDDSLKQILKEKKNKKQKILKLGEYGCILSHCHLWKDLAQRNDKDIILIFEDDLDIDKDFKKKMNKILDKLPNDWDVFLIGHLYLNKRTNKIIDNDIVKVGNGGFFRTHCYLINAKAAKKMVKYCNIMEISKPLDLLMTELLKKKVINVYGTHTEYVKQNSGYSDTQGIN